MAMKAKYAGKCNICGGQINVGEEIEWTRGEGASHIECPKNPEPFKPRPRKIKSRFSSNCIECGLKINEGEEIYYLRNKGAWHVDCSVAKEEDRKEHEIAPYKISRGSAYGESYLPGQIIEAPKYLQEEGIKYLYVVKASERYFKYDGLSFGVGDESGYVYTAHCRKATTEEATSLIEKKKKAEERKAVQNELAEIKTQIQETGERPEEDVTLNGEIICEENKHLVVSGGGTWFVIEENAIWFVQNNGGDGDDWSYNNICTGGAGAIGWKVPYNTELANRLRKINEQMNI